MFFHEGEYVPAATDTGHAVGAVIERLTDTTGSVTYMWPGDDYAGEANTAVSTYSWDEASESVIREGELPPS